jgi:hypothetical protein
MIALIMLLLIFSMCVMVASAQEPTETPTPTPTATPTAEPSVTPTPTATPTTAATLEPSVTLGDGLIIAMLLVTNVLLAVLAFFAMLRR